MRSKTQEVDIWFSGCDTREGKRKEKSDEDKSINCVESGRVFTVSPLQHAFAFFILFLISCC
jgi:hypothetical protein